MEIKNFYNYGTINDIHDNKQVILSANPQHSNPQEPPQEPMMVLPENPENPENPAADTADTTPTPLWEEAIPAHLRIGRLELAWRTLQREGILEGDFQLSATHRSKALARDIATHICLMHDEKQSIEWLHFEKLWGMNDLAHSQKYYAKDLQIKISHIFSRI